GSSRSARLSSRRRIPKKARGRSQRSASRTSNASDVAVMRVVVLADTHIRAGRSRALPTQVWDAIDDCQLVLHAGDVVDATLLDALAVRGRPPITVYGNNDAALPDLPERRELDIEGVRIAM